jgi:DNA-binding NtrC family response regulator
VVDDELAARRALSMLLADEGYEVDVAASGEEALASLARATPDALLTDVRMPGMGGIELLTRARAVAPGLPVVVMTAYGTDRDAAAAVVAGADSFLTKPLDFDALGRALRRAIERRPADR